ncbi:efflux RND transporter periplasmic adaptor subunit (plasmid) [Mesorhizobium huakuii]|uniref:Efflux RND transporter periplasmic adaptor subunit n=1 Tax=Mesorhizobium huakuii TaxID=28104 RepID=A0A7G6T4B3_9HYPH|nr:efflux RND transporter periplasmic adaptor subunit [Mesorhizobium huakuii]QND69209.1 efflux RND transporter periplasmic adaptor subunit [Mesorhizobium loti]
MEPPVRDDPENQDNQTTSGKTADGQRSALGTVRWLALGVILVVAAGAGALTLRQGDTAPLAKIAAAPIPVTAAIASVRDLPIARTGLGTVLPLNQVDVKARVDGQIQRIFFGEGEEVKAGDILAQIDPRAYAALLAQAQATLQKDVAQLANARADEARATKLTQSGAGTTQAADTARAQVAVMQAAVDGDQAAVDTAKLNLDYATITAPISGRVGLKQANEGTLVHANDATGIVTITQMQPIAVQFSLPQDQLPDLQSGQSAGSLPVAADARDSSRKIADGKLTAIDSQIDTTTGMIKLKAEFDNNDKALWPGALVTVQVGVRTEHNAVVLPSAAVQSGQSGPYVFVVKPDNTVTIAKVTTGDVVGDVTMLTSGAVAGDNIVVSGQSRLTEGTSVKVTQADDPSQKVALETK